MSLQDEYKQLKKRLAEYRADPQALLAALDEIQQMCLEGITQEKVHAKMDTPMVVVERLPDVARRCAMDKWEMVKHIEAQAGQEQAEQTELLPAWDSEDG